MTKVGMDVPSASVEAALRQAELTEPHIHAFAWLDPAYVRRKASGLEQRAEQGNDPKAGLLQGVLVGVKDVIDTAGTPTENGSAMYAGRVPDRSATVVLNLGAAGAIVFGKTVTTECAFFHPGPTRNPWNTARTSGGSSMGSAAAVAAGVIPAAIGTQTNGSVIRPAAFCGVVGFKPSDGRIAKDGVLRFSGTLDQLGGFTRSVPEAARLAAGMAGEPLSLWWDESWDVSGDRQKGLPSFRPRLAVARTAEWSHADAAMQAQFEADVAALRAAGAEIVEGEGAVLPGGLDACVPVHRTIMQFEGTEALGALVASQPQNASETLRRYVEDGASISRASYMEALRERERMIAAFTPWSTEFDAILTPPASGEAPTPETTGDPRFCTRWTLMGAPALTLPTGLGPSELPLGLQLVGTPGNDRRLLRTAAWVESISKAPVWSLARLDLPGN